MPLNIAKYTVRTQFIPTERRIKYSGSDPSPLLVDNDTFFGVEVELEKCPHEVPAQPSSSIGPHTLLPTVHAHADGSLRNHGIEFVTTPVNGSDLITSVEHICDLADTMELVTSNRAGVHIHVDVQKYTGKELLNFLSLYTLIEPVVFAQAGDHRRGSIYCKSWYEGSENGDLAACIRMLAKGEPTPLRSRYLGLNPNSVFKHGTLEFRHLESTKDAERIISWINFLSTIKKYAESTELLDPDKVRNLVPDLFLRDIFGTRVSKLVPQDFYSYFYQACVPLWFDLFEGETTSARDWQKKGPVQAHKGFTKFQAKIKPKSSKKGRGSPLKEAIFDLNMAAPELPDVQAPLRWSTTDGWVYRVRPAPRPVEQGIPNITFDSDGRRWERDGARLDLQCALSNTTERADHGAGWIVYRYARP